MSTSGDVPRQVTANIRINEGGINIEGKVTVSTGPTRISEMLPLARSLADGIVNETVRATSEAGHAISCKAGCGACCRMMVQISEVEARRLRTVVDEMPEPRRTKIRKRFDAAMQNLTGAGLGSLRYTERLTAEAIERLNRQYFEQQVPCPFLENESCSIYEERPITCREYLVTSSPEHCATPSEGRIQRVRIPLRLFNAIASWQVPPSTHVRERWVPLTFALDWAEKHPNDPAPIAGTELLRDLLSHLSGEGSSAE
jgi:Fe-S-cluster containining protein